MTAILAIPVGVVIGISLGALGGGGSILTVPALVYLLEQGAKGATTASLIIVGVTSLAGMVVHHRSNRVRVREGLVFGVLGAGGSYVGSRLSASIDTHVLLAAFSVLMLVVAGSMARRRRHRSPAVELAGGPARPERIPVAAGAAGAAGAGGVPAPSAPTGPDGSTAPDAGSPGSVRRSRPDPVRVVVAATIVGLITGFFGVGGGFVVVPALVLALGFTMPVAVGTSLLVIAINSASALAFRIGSHAHLDPALVASFTVAAIAGTVAGGRIASRTRPEKLLGAFAVLLVAVAVYTAARSVPHLF